MKKFNAQKVLCSWGIHSHNKEVLFVSEDVELKFKVKICPHCECPKKKFFRVLFSNGSMLISQEHYNELTKKRN